MTSSTEISTSPRRERTLIRSIIVVIVAVLALVVLQSLFAHDDSPAQHQFVELVRAEHPQLSLAVATDDELVDVARSACTPEGISPRERTFLERIGVDATDFVESAQVLCPTR